ncbi:nuclear pore complex protein Nup54 [Macrosteles quadrilineatus]|uniref:nuclear pore complex protein Nup54 n=1 Tax=Macrosteles quadrilineatus TaxID=74068 RepID=UPI0023E11D8C|nr:nuclear pore complex protein Nup54 [Macrosteles quadrilineatus]
MAFNVGNTPMFGAAQATSTPFGNTTANKPLFGQSTLSFGTPQASTPSFNLGSNTTTTSTGFGFGSNPTTTTSLGGFGTFGSATTSTATGFGSFGGFGSTTTTSAPSFGFGSTTTTGTTGTGLFSGGFGQQNTSLSGTTSTGFGGFGNFGAKPLGTQPTQSTFGGFGQTSGLGTFGQVGQTQQQQQQQQQQQNPLEAIYRSVFQCNIFNDERDQVLARWNLLQALWGVGKGWYDNSQPPAEYTPENPLCRFKSVGYSRKPSTEPKDGIVSLIFKKKEADVRNEENQIVTNISNILGNKPNLTVTIEAIKAMSDEKTQVLFYVQEKAANGMIKRVVNSEVGQFLRTPGPSQTLMNLGVENVFCFQGPDADQVKEYLDNPPAGIDPRLWKQAQLDNPDPEKLLPVPIIGFSDIRWRAKCQENETKVHHAVLDKISGEISELKRQNSETVAKIAEYKQRVMDLEHRVLKVLVKQEATRNVGIALRPEEEALRSQLEALHSQVNTPAQFKGRLNELLSLMRMQRQESSQAPSERYSMDPDAQEEIHQFLLEQHYAMQQVVQTVNQDLKDLKTMTEGFSTLLRES